MHLWAGSIGFRPGEGLFDDCFVLWREIVIIVTVYSQRGRDHYSKNLSILNILPYCDENCFERLKSSDHEKL